MTTKGRVLHLIDTGGPGGAETVFMELVHRLPTVGWEALPVVPRRDWLAEALDSRDVATLEIAPAKSFDLTYVKKLRTLVHAQGIGLVQTHLLGTSYYATLACLGTQIPVVSTFHGRPDIGPSERLRRVKTGLLRRARNRTVCVSESLRRHFIATGDLGDRTEVIPNGVDLSAFRPGGPTPLRDELGLAPDAPLIGAVGNVRRSKAYPVLLRAFSRVREAIPNAHLVVAGAADGVAHEELCALRTTLGLEDASHFLGFRTDVREVLTSLDVFALSSSDEGFSLATVQAMATGLPVVATRSGGPDEIVGDSEAAILVSPDDPDALGAELIRVLQDRSLADTLGRAAHHHAVAGFSVESMVNRYADLYERAMGGG